MPATIKDIATRLNISSSTVSYALNGGPRTVSDDIVKRVLETAKELDYRPNRLARSLVTRKMGAVGVVFDRSTADLILSPYRQWILNSILNALGAKKIDALITAAVDDDGQPHLEGLLDGRVDGHILLSPQQDLTIAAELEQRQIPFVSIGGGPKFPTDFSVDNSRGIELALDYLANLGHTKIAFVKGLPGLSDAIEREAAFRSRTAERGLAIPSHWVVNGGFTEAGGWEAATALMAHPPIPTAILCANDESAKGVLRALKSRGVRVPEDASIVGFDDLPLSRDLEPTLTTVRQPLETLGHAAVAALLRLIEGEECAPQLFAPSLIKRESTSRPTEDTIK
jgi:DNA-binding LacI/PurR family transcriptional regulator